MERFSLENLDKFVVPGQNVRPNVLQSLFPHFPIVAPHPSRSLTSGEHELPAVPQVSKPSCSLFIVVVRSSQSAKMVKHDRQTAADKDC